MQENPSCYLWPTLTSIQVSVPRLNNMPSENPILPLGNEEDNKEKNLALIIVRLLNKSSETMHFFFLEMNKSNTSTFPSLARVFMLS